MATSQVPLQSQAEPSRLYCVCFFSSGWITPEVQFLDAENDEDALLLARSIRPWMTREIWDRHRLVRLLPPNN